MPALEFLAGYAWVIGAVLGGLFYYFLMSGRAAPVARAGAAPCSPAGTSRATSRFLPGFLQLTRMTAPDTERAGK